MNNSIDEKLINAPYFSLENVGSDLYEKFKSLNRTLKNRGAEDFHSLNNEKVTGVWYFTHLKFEENAPQLLIRTAYEKKSYEYLLVCSEIHEFVKQDVAFHYSDLSNESMIIGQKEELLREIEKGRILIVYCKEREA